MLLLIVDDDATIRRNLESFLKDKFTVETCENGLTALEKIRKKSFDLVISDNQMPGMTGMELLKKVRELSPSTTFVMMTAFGSDEESVNAIKLGADDYLTKPFSLAEANLRLSRLADLKTWSAQNILREQDGYGLKRLVGKSSAVQETKQFVTRVAAADAPVLIAGPTGTGKELLARAIHEVGPRAKGPFIAINCGALNENLIESELFGHEKGSFTGAIASKPGKFELAKRGTLFLDEVGELSLGLQVKLLRVLQEKEFYRVGGDRLIESDARIIAASHRSLPQMVEDGSFREDLFFRFNVLTHAMAPLSERREDLPLLIDHVLERLRLRTGKRVRLSVAARELISNYDFPGNIRELQNMLERLVVLNEQDAEIGETQLPPEVRSGEDVARLGLNLSVPSGGLEQALEAYEKQIVLLAMAMAKHNQSDAARLLKVERTTLRYKLKKYGYRPPVAHKKAA